MYETSGYTQGTTYHILYDKHAGNKTQELSELIAQLDHSLSVWDSLSLVSQFNRSKEGIWADSYLIELVQLSKKIHIETEGAFNPAIYPLISYAGRDTIKQSDSLLKFTQLNDITLSPETEENSIFLRKRYPQNGLDFQGIVCGFVVDKVCAYLDAKNIQNYRVEVGNQLKSKGKNAEHQPWKIALDKPSIEGEDRAIAHIIPIKEKSVSIVGNYRDYYEKNGEKYNKSINPTTGQRSENTLVNVYLFGGDCASTNAYASAFLVMGAGNATRFLAKHNNLDAYLISSGYNNDFLLWQSHGLENLIQESK